MTFTTWDNTCPYVACRKPVEAELDGLEPDGYRLTCNNCGRLLVLRVYDGFKLAILTKPIDVPLPGFADRGRSLFGGEIPDDWPGTPGDGLPPRRSAGD